MNIITDEDKLRCAERELGLRKKVYARHVEAGWKTLEFAQREIAIMEAIVADYRAKVELPL